MWATVLSVQIRPARARVRSLALVRHQTLANSGSGGADAAGAPAATAVLASGDRAAEDHPLRVEWQLAHLLGVPLTL